MLKEDEKRMTSMDTKLFIKKESSAHNVWINFLSGKQEFNEG